MEKIKFDVVKLDKHENLFTSQLGAVKLSSPGDIDVTVIEATLPNLKLAVPYDWFKSSEQFYEYIVNSDTAMCAVYSMLDTYIAAINSVIRLMLRLGGATQTAKYIMQEGMVEDDLRYKLEFLRSLATGMLKLSKMESEGIKWFNDCPYIKNKMSAKNRYLFVKSETMSGVMGVTCTRPSDGGETNENDEDAIKYLFGDSGDSFDTDKDTIQIWFVDFNFAEPIDPKFQLVTTRDRVFENLFILCDTRDKLWER